MAVGIQTLHTRKSHRSYLKVRYQARLYVTDSLNQYRMNINRRPIICHYHDKYLMLAFRLSESARARDKGREIVKRAMEVKR